MVLSVVAELRSRFDVYMKTGDDSNITVDLQESIYSQAVKWGWQRGMGNRQANRQDVKEPLGRRISNYCDVFHTRSGSYGGDFQSHLDGDEGSGHVLLLRGPECEPGHEAVPGKVVQEALPYCESGLHRHGDRQLMDS